MADPFFIYLTDVLLEFHAPRRHRRSFLLLGLVGHNGLGLQQQARHRRRIFQRRVRDLRRIDHTLADQVAVLLDLRVEAEIVRTLTHPLHDVRLLHTVIDHESKDSVIHRGPCNSGFIFRRGSRRSGALRNECVAESIRYDGDDFGYRIPTFRIRDDSGYGIVARLIKNV